MKKLATLWPIGLVVLLFVVYAWLLLGHFGMTYDLKNPDHGGVMGDAFGVLTSLFNGLAFAGLLIALNFQRQELALQREELKLQRQELVETRKVMQEQETQMRLSAEAAQRQLFESTFFSLLGSFQRFVEGINYAGSNAMRTDAATGREALSIHFERLFGYESGVIAKLENVGEIATIYASWMRSYDHIIGAYVDMLLAVFDFIQSSERPNKAFYFDLARSSLSRPEKTLLFYHGVSIPEHRRLKTYIERYSLFRDVDKQTLHRSQRNIDGFFQTSAYDSEIPYQSP